MNVRSALGLLAVWFLCTGIVKPVPASASPKAVELDASYEDPDGFFSLDYPSSWVANRARSEIQFLADRNGNAGLAVSLQIKSVSPEALVDEISKLLAQKRDSYKAQPGVEAEIDGYPAVWLDYAYTQKGKAQRGFIAGAVRNRVGFLVLGWAPKADYAKLKPAFESIVDSLDIAEFRDAPGYDDWLTHKTDHFTFYYLPKTYVARAIKSIARDHEATYSGIVDALELDYDESIDFFFYPSAQSLVHATARDAGHANNEAGEVHSIWVSAKDHQTLGHEMTHVITHGALGDPQEALLGEGIAVCMDHSGRDPHALAADLIEAGQLIPLSDMLGDAWFEHDGAVTYPQSGSFACYLLDQYGVDGFKEVYAAEDFPAAVEETYGASLAAIEKQWLKMLKGG